MIESAWAEENNERGVAANIRVPLNCSLSYFRGISRSVNLPSLGCVRQAATVSRYREAEAQTRFFFRFRTRYFGDRGLLSCKGYGQSALVNLDDDWMMMMMIGALGRVNYYGYLRP